MLQQSRILTEKFIRGLRPAALGTRYGIADAVVPGLALWVSDFGEKTFSLEKSLARKKADRVLGRFGTDISLGEARKAAVGRIEELARSARGDPKPRPVKKAKADLTFASAVEDFLKQHVRGQRQGHHLENEFRRVLLPRWGHIQLSRITRRDLVDLIDEQRARTTITMAHRLFAYCRLFFNWAIERGRYGIETSPCDRVRPTRLIGPYRHRQRILTDVELSAIWRVCDRVGFPGGPACRMLLLTGQRRSEVAGASWSEFDLDKRLWTIPQERFKTGNVHQVPLSEPMIALLRTLPRWEGMDYVFPRTMGNGTIIGFSRLKTFLDWFLRAELPVQRDAMSLGPTASALFNQQRPSLPPESFALPPA